MTKVSLVLLLAVASCGGTPHDSAKPQPATSVVDLVPMCQRLFARKQACADDYLPRLLDLRIELNLPPGIADVVASEGRDAALVRAHTELARDTQPDKVTPLCEEGAAQVKQHAPELADQLVRQFTSCDATSDCRAFASCAVEIDRRFIRTGPKHR